MSGQPNGFADKVSFIWGVADLLRGDFKAHESPGHPPLLRAKMGELSAGADSILKRVSSHAFYNTSPLDLTKLLNDPGKVAPNMRTNLAAFSPSARSVLEAYGFEEKVGRLDKAGLLYQVVARFAELDLSENGGQPRARPRTRFSTGKSRMRRSSRRTSTGPGSARCSTSGLRRPSIGRCAKQGRRHERAGQPGNA